MKVILGLINHIFPNSLCKGMEVCVGRTENRETGVLAAT